MRDSRVTVVGGGLAGTEAALQLARRGVDVALYEMRPSVPTPAHRTDRLAELVCSNSLKSDRANTAPWLLKEEMRRAGSLLLRIAAQCAVPAGQALAVDRERFSCAVTEAIGSEPHIRLIRDELREVPSSGTVIIATGPLTSDALAQSIQALTGSQRLFFYDAISPIVDATTIDRSTVFAASRYGKTLRTITDGVSNDDGDPALAGVRCAEEPEGDYLNCPFDEQQYQRFYEALIAAESVPLHGFEDPSYFEGCLPIEELARRGRDTLRFGPMKPVGLRDPRTGRMPYAAAQLRQENLRADSYNLVGFQNHLKFGEQKRVLRLIPGLEQAEFLRYGQIHRNTYISAPELLTPTLQLRAQPRIFFAGQICGVEGYVESIATGMMAGMHAARMVLSGEEPLAPPRATALGSLCYYITHADARNYQPANIAFDLLPPLCSTTPQKLPRAERHAKQCEIALAKFSQWLDAINAPARSGP
jgi:methylenetetrahydrofolate--tRNA-(uracil-5-)-methyltransferase